MLAMSKHTQPIHLYAAQMREIKQRTEVVDFFLHKGGHALYQPTTIESICLQFRKILELIAFSSLIANKDRYATVHKNFALHWNAELLLKDLARVNPDFYPKPIEKRPSTVPGVLNDLVPITDGHLTQEDFTDIYKKCGGMMHAANPYGSKTGSHYFEKSFPLWRAKLIRLLNCHQVHLIGETSFWLIHMRENGDEEVHFYQFGLVKEHG
jgi:hypothetical protein